MTQVYNNSAFAADRLLAEAERKLLEQQAYVGRLTVCGGSTQATEDRLRQLERELIRLRTAQHRRHTGGCDIEGGQSRRRSSVCRDGEDQIFGAPRTHSSGGFPLLNPTASNMSLIFSI
jgi:hypothetical protein